MTCAFSPPTHATSAPEALVVDAVRCWREARDRHNPVLPILFARLEDRQAGFLAPAINALLAMHEAWSGRPFHAGDPATLDLTGDERRLLASLEMSTPSATAGAARPSLIAPLRIALRSTRIILRSMLGQDEVGRPPPPADDVPIFFAHTGELHQAPVPAIPARETVAHVPS